MVKLPFTSKVRQAFGRPLAKLSIKLKDGTVVKDHGIKILKPTGEYDAFTVDEAGYQQLVAAGEAPGHMEIVKWYNAKSLAAAKGQANTKAVKDAGFLEPDASNDQTIQWQHFYEAFLGLVKNLPDWKDKPEDDQKAEARRRATEQSGIEAPVEEEEEE